MTDLKKENSSWQSGSRKLKFRAWFKKDNIMSFFTLLEMMNGDSIDTPDLIMEYTWLKDKDWKEVYEWDIVKCTSWCPHTVIFKIAHWWNVLWWLPTFYLSWLNYWYQRTGDEEVIWNIYQNPELVPEK